MKSKVFDAGYNLITEDVSEVLISLDTLKIKNRLLDGTYHIQIIGSAVKQIEIECLVDESGKTTIDTAESRGAPITLEREGEYYNGLLDTPAQCNTIVKSTGDYRMYSCKFKLMVTQEGVI